MAGELIVNNRRVRSLICLAGLVAVLKCVSLTSGECFGFQAPPSYAAALRSRAP